MTEISLDALSKGRPARLQIAIRVREALRGRGSWQLVLLKIQMTYWSVRQGAWLCCSFLEVLGCWLVGWLVAWFVGWVSKLLE